MSCLYVHYKIFTVDLKKVEILDFGIHLLTCSKVFKFIKCVGKQCLCSVVLQQTVSSLSLIHIQMCIRDRFIIKSVTWLPSNNDILKNQQKCLLFWFPGIRAWCVVLVSRYQAMVCCFASIVDFHWLFILIKHYQDTH